MNTETRNEGPREGVRVDTQIYPDGKRVVRRYEDGVLVTELHIETLASGKEIHREFDGNTQLKRETQSYGMLKISLTSEFIDGKKASERYLVNSKLASRRTYEKARSRYSDMPIADTSLEDFGGEILKAAAAEHRRAAAARKSHVSDPKRASANDGFCRERMSTGVCADAQNWLNSRSHTLGEMNHTESRRLLQKLARHGAVRIFACEIDDYGEQGQNTGHLVIELPNEKPLRAKLLESIARIAESKGFSGYPDDGQRYAYVKLD